MAARRRRPYLRLVLVLVPLLAVLAGVAVVGGNTFGRPWIEGQVRLQLAAQTSLTGAPTVELRDKIVALSVARQRFDEVHVVLPGLELKEVREGVRADIDLLLRDVVASQRFTRYVAGSLTGTTTFSWQQVSSVVGQPVAAEPGGRVALTYAFTLAGARVTAQVSAKPALDASGALYLAEPAVLMAGFPVPPAIVKQIADTLVRPVPLGFPQGIKATAVSAEPAGLTFTLAGKNVDVTALR